MANSEQFIKDHDDLEFTDDCLKVREKFTNSEFPANIQSNSNCIEPRKLKLISGMSGSDFSSSENAVPSSSPLSPKLQPPSTYLRDPRVASWITDSHEFPPSPSCPSVSPSVLVELNFKLSQEVDDTQSGDGGVSVVKQAPDNTIEHTKKENISSRSADQAAIHSVKESTFDRMQKKHFPSAMSPRLSTHVNKRVNEREVRMSQLSNLRDFQPLKEASKHLGAEVRHDKSNLFPIRFVSMPPDEYPTLNADDTPIGRLLKFEDISKVENIISSLEGYSTVCPQIPFLDDQNYSSISGKEGLIDCSEISEDIIEINKVFLDVLSEIRKREILFDRMEIEGGKASQLLQSALKLQGLDFKHIENFNLFSTPTETADFIKKSREIIENAARVEKHTALSFENYSNNIPTQSFLQMMMARLCVPTNIFNNCSTERINPLSVFDLSSSTVPRVAFDLVKETVIKEHLFDKNNDASFSNLTSHCNEVDSSGSKRRKLNDNSSTVNMLSQFGCELAADLPLHTLFLNQKLPTIHQTMSSTSLNTYIKSHDNLNNNFDDVNPSLNTCPYPTQSPVISSVSVSLLLLEKAFTKNISLMFPSLYLGNQSTSINGNCNKSSQIGTVASTYVDDPSNIIASSGDIIVRKKVRRKRQSINDDGVID